MRRALLLGIIAASGCKEVIQDHCKWRGEHVFCAASFPEAPFCSPCEVVEQNNGCVAEEPSKNACPEFEPPPESSSSGTETDTETG